MLKAMKAMKAMRRKRMTMTIMRRRRTRRRSQIAMMMKKRIMHGMQMGRKFLSLISPLSPLGNFIEVAQLERRVNNNTDNVPVIMIHRTLCLLTCILTIHMYVKRFCRTLFHIGIALRPYYWAGYKIRIGQKSPR
jgi:hypothetical protein